MKVNVIIERGEKSGLYSAYMDYYDALKFGINGYGRTIEQAKEDFLIARDEMKECCESMGIDFPEDLEFDFKYDVASFLEYYSNKLSPAGLQSITGIKQEQLNHYITGTKKLRRKIIESIEKKLHEFAEDMQQLHF
ncbi:hypothetical protein EZS27_008132 [termite gut metagenome]|uniref:Uncharacterized protein n=1 Tax=termite gut metagenome TaxID=433724 RepID=A0A5J4SDL6_9ZZZZ